MNNFSGFAILNVILIVIGTILLIKELYILRFKGKSIMKAGKKSLLSIFWVGALIFWCLSLFYAIRLYSFYQKDSVITNILTSIFWIELSILNLIKSFISSEIRENGIYKAGCFYKWSKIKSYRWILENTIKFQVNTFLKGDINVEIEINEEFKAKADDIIQMKIG